MSLEEASIVSSWPQTFSGNHLIVYCMDDSEDKDDMNSCSAFVGNVPYKIGWRELKVFFSQFGPVAYVKCVRHAITKRNLGAAFIQFGDKDTADAAKNANHQELTLHGRIMRVRDSRPNARKQDMRQPQSEDVSSSDSKNQDNSSSPFSVLNDDCLVKILSFVEPFERMRLEKVNKTWKRCASLASKSQRHLVLRKQSNTMFRWLPEYKICRMIARCCNNLTSLDLSLVPMQVQKSAVETVAKCCKKLEVLNLCGCLSVSNHGISNIVSGCPKLKWLNIDSCCRVTEKGMSSILYHCQELKVLHCNGNTFTGKCLKFSPKSLRELYMSKCTSLTGEGILRLSMRCSNITNLNFNNCMIKSRGAVSELLKSQRYLEQVDIGNCFSGKLPNGNAANMADQVLHRHVVQFLARPEIITDLMVDNTEMSDNDLIFICNRCPSIVCLDISCNPLTDVSVTQLSALSQLETLSICHLFNITNSGLINLVLNGNLKVLRMQGCKKIDDDLLVPLSQSCADLKELDIAGVVKATRKSLYAFIDAAEEHNNQKLCIYAHSNTFMDQGYDTGMAGLLLRIVYRQLYSTHYKWLLEADDEPYNIVINRRRQPDELEPYFDWQQAGLADVNNGHAQAGIDDVNDEYGQVLQALPAELADCDKWEEFHDDFDGVEEFLVNDDPLEQELYDFS